MAVIDLSQLPAPEVIEVPDFETLLAERKENLIALYPSEQQGAMRSVLALESDPLVKCLQENVYREILLRQRINEAAQAVMVAYALGTDLDQLAANNNVKRLTITPANPDAVPPVAAVMESDDDLRLRVPGAFEGLSVAGPTAAYEFYAKSADGRVSDVSATSPAPAEVLITVLSRDNSGAATADLLNAVNVALNAEEVRPVADRVTVQAAAIFDYQVKAKLHLFDGVAAGPCLEAAQAAMNAYLTDQKKLGRSVRRESYGAVLRVAGVDWVEITEPAQDIILNRTQAGNCTAVAVTVASDNGGKG
ncbi:baseplate assembly protein [Pantoea stewartii subsp. indologenes]|uniref:baseplate assembly protein n=1 Tax=Pantoea stewartii TaxID=66269 RepID=UPI00050DE5E7|nr:baseplate J/gp47 family protein [Pantoea stewartii]KGD83531.1 baseplate assembly protein [Pantoea stewartii subsp. indologenes]